jgi:hypothetical protein
MSSGKGRKNSGNLPKNLVENVEFFFIIWRFPFPDVLYPFPIEWDETSVA